MDRVGAWIRRRLATSQGVDGNGVNPRPGNPQNGPRRVFPAGVLMLLAAGALLTQPVTAESTARVSGCIGVRQVTTFAPRGDVYVEVQASCTPEHFDAEDPIVAYLEVLVRDASPVGEDVRVYADRPNQRSTLEFHDLHFETGDSILVRLSRFGQILAIQSVQVP
jgi:hypothetical protein